MRSRCLISQIVLAGLLILVLAEVSPAQERRSERRILIGFRNGRGRQAAEKRRNWVHNFGGDVHHSFHLLPVVSARLPERLVARLRSRGEIAFIEDDLMVRVVEQEIPWGVEQIDADLAWAWTANTGEGVDLAILDTGIDYDHPDLVDNIAGGVSYTAWRRTDGSTERRRWNDRHGHGSHCAGIVAASDNDIGVVGVAPGARLWAVKVLGSDGYGYISDVIQGLQWCADNRIEIASMSFGAVEHSQSLQDACDEAYSDGVLLVAAAGNYGSVNYPAAYDSVVAVSATNASDVIASWSSTGPEVELAAPGVNIYSTFLGGGYAIGSGTSMACPHVAGAAALVIANDPSLSCDQVRIRLQQTAKDLGSPGKDDFYGYGRVDAIAAVAGSSEPPAADFIGNPTSGEVPLTVDFTDQSTGAVIGWFWEFGDGQNSAEQNPSHTYEIPGIYTVILTATGPHASDTETKTDYVSVTPPPAPTAEFVASLTSGEAPLTVEFTDQSTGSITDWFWEFGDEETSFESNPLHTYEMPGAYSVSLTVTGPGGSDAEIRTNYISVETPAAPLTEEFNYSGVAIPRRESRHTVSLSEPGTMYVMLTWRRSADLILRIYSPAGNMVAEVDESSRRNWIEEITIGLGPGDWQVAVASHSRRRPISYTIEGIVNY